MGYLSYGHYYIRLVLCLVKEWRFFHNMVCLGYVWLVDIVLYPFEIGTTLSSDLNFLNEWCLRFKLQKLECGGEELCVRVHVFGMILWFLGVFLFHFLCFKFLLRITKYQFIFKHHFWRLLFHCVNCMNVWFKKQMSKNE